MQLAWSFSHHQILNIQRNGYYFSTSQKVHHSSATTLTACLNKVTRCVSTLWNRYLEEGIIYEQICTLGKNAELWDKIQTTRFRWKRILTLYDPYLLISIIIKLADEQHSQKDAVVLLLFWISTLTTASKCLLHVFSECHNLQKVGPLM